MKLGLTTALALHHRIKDLLAGIAYPIYWLRILLSRHMAHSDGAANDANIVRVLSQPDDEITATEAQAAMQPRNM